MQNNKKITELEKKMKKDKIRNNPVISGLVFQNFFLEYNQMTLFIKTILKQFYKV